MARNLSEAEGEGLLMKAMNRQKGRFIASAPQPTKSIPVSEDIVPKPEKPAKRIKSAKESVLQGEILHYLRVHPKVAWAAKVGSGAFQTEGRYIKMGFVGCPDIIGQLAGSGKFLGIEVKRPGGKVTIPQQTMIDRINAAGGLAGVCYSLEDVDKLLTGFPSAFQAL